MSIPSPTSTSATQVRVRWDNVMIVLIGAAVAAAAVVFVVMTGDAVPPTKRPAAPAKHAAAAPDTDPSATTDGGLDIDDARGLLEEARTLMADARWAEATDRLDTIPADLREIVGSSALAAEIDTKSAAWELHRTRLDAAVKGQQWKVARVELDELATLARLDTQLLELDATIDRELAATPATDTTTKQSTSGTTGSPATAKPATGSTTGGGAAGAGQGTTKPAGGSTKPATGTTKPSSGTTKPATGTTKPSTGTTKPGSALPGLDVNLTPAQQAELEKALGDALGQVG